MASRGQLGGMAASTPQAVLLEVADLLVVNKCDRDGADAAVRELHKMIAIGGERGPGEWRPVVVRATATVAGGIDELVEAIDKQRAWPRVIG
jgi:LAO/AO transport system kinase